MDEEEEQEEEERSCEDEMLEKETNERAGCVKVFYVKRRRSKRCKTRGRVRIDRDRDRFQSARRGMGLRMEE